MVEQLGTPRHRRLEAREVDIGGPVLDTDLVQSSVSFVLGTNVLGPMGRELVPVSTTDAALTLLEDHGGQRILTFDQVTVDLLP